MFQASVARRVVEDQVSALVSKDYRQSEHEHRDVFLRDTAFKYLKVKYADIYGYGDQKRDVSPALGADDPVDTLADRSPAVQGVSQISGHFVFSYFCSLCPS